MFDFFTNTVKSIQTIHYSTSHSTAMQHVTELIYTNNCGYDINSYILFIKLC